MAEPIDWDGLFAEYATVRTAALSGREPWKPFELPKEAIRRATSPKSDDLCWMTEALGHEERKWFVAEIFRNSKSVPEGLFISMLDAGIDGVNPSLNRSFIEPVVRSFGHRRIVGYCPFPASRERGRSGLTAKQAMRAVVGKVKGQRNISPFRDGVTPARLLVHRAHI
jgi:hypothetical protein